MKPRTITFLISLTFFTIILLCTIYPTTTLGDTEINNITSELATTAIPAQANSTTPNPTPTPEPTQTPTTTPQQTTTPNPTPTTTNSALPNSTITPTITPSPSSSPNTTTEPSAIEYVLWASLPLLIIVTLVAIFRLKKNAA